MKENVLVFPMADILQNKYFLQVCWDLLDIPKGRSFYATSDSIGLIVNSKNELPVNYSRKSNGTNKKLE